MRRPADRWATVPSAIITNVVVLFSVACVPLASNAVAKAVSPSALAGRFPVMGESSLVDGETGRVYWQGGPGSIRLSSDAISRKTGVKHLRATVLTSILALSLLSTLAGWVRDRLADFVAGRKAAAAEERRLHRTALVFLARCAAVLLHLPIIDPWFVAVTAVLYLLEAYTCSTRRFLDNALSGPAGVEEYVEALRKVRPVVVWKVRCFHYERRQWLAWLTLVEVWRRTLKRGLISKDFGKAHMENEEEATLLPMTESFLTQKVVTHSASKQYEFVSWSDNTVAGVWKRAWAPDAAAPFAKLSLSKMLVLSDEKAREDYFAQQSQFVAREGQRDEYAEFSTSIQVEGFKPKVLAVRPVGGTPFSKLFRIHFFWLFTALGLTVPYRIWFSRHCDELSVSIVKQTSGAAEGSVSSPPSWYWFLSRGNSIADSLKERGEMFRRKMQQISLYEKDSVKGERMMETLIELQHENTDAGKAVMNGDGPAGQILTESDRSTAENGAVHKDVPSEDVSTKRDDGSSRA